MSQEGLLILPFWEGPKKAFEHEIAFQEEISLVLQSKDFVGKMGEVALLYPKGERVLLLGLGKEEKASSESIRRAYANGVKKGIEKKVQSAQIALPAKEAFSKAAVEGSLFANYVFNDLKGVSKKEAPLPIRSIEWEGRIDPSFVAKAEELQKALFLARDLVNQNADTVTPEFLAQKALSLEKLSSHLKVHVRDEAWLKEKKMGLILAVSRGASVPPRLIEMVYRNNPESNDLILLVGKGITYDTGGLALKPADGMVSMKADMGGSAAVIGAMQAIASLNLKVNVVGIVASAENGIDAKSYKNGDVYTSYSGRTVEVTNTDAEGRLVLADAISYGIETFSPTKIVDLATLTGAMVISLGEEYAGFFTNQEEMAKEFRKASEGSGELIWQMPLYQDYWEDYKSDIADMVNSAGRYGSAIKAALFLEQFVENIPWVHLDIAGPAFLSKPKHYSPTKATGFGVRLLIDWLEKT